MSKGPRKHRPGGAEAAAGGGEAARGGPRPPPRQGDDAPRNVEPWRGDKRQGRTFGGRDRQGGRGVAAFPADVAVLYGFHSVREALRSTRRKLIRLRGTPSALEGLASEITRTGVKVVPATNEEIGALLPADAVHQGLLLESAHIEPVDLADLPADALVLVLDQITDPHNVGAIVRTAAAFGVDAIVTTERHSPALTGVLAKSASGGLEHVGMAIVVNLARALERLGDLGFLRVGLDSEGPASLEQTPLTRPLALVLGAEGKGLRRLSRENCDVLARLDMPGAIKSLNVSNACAVALTIARARLSETG